MTLLRRCASFALVVSMVLVAAGDQAKADDQPMKLGSLYTGIGVAGGDLRLSTPRASESAGSARLDLRLGGDTLSGIAYSRAAVSGSLGWGGAKLEGALDGEIVYGLRPSLGRWHGPLLAIEGHYGLAGDADSSRELSGAGLMLGYQLWKPRMDGATYLELAAVGEGIEDHVSFRDVSAEVGFDPGVGGRLRIHVASVWLNARYLRVFGSEQGLSTPLDDAHLFTCTALDAFSLCFDTSYDAGTGFAASGAAEHLAAAYAGVLVSFDPFRHAMLEVARELPAVHEH